MVIVDAPVIVVMHPKFIKELANKIQRLVFLSDLVKAIDEECCKEWY